MDNSTYQVINRFGRTQTFLSELEAHAHAEWQVQQYLSGRVFNSDPAPTVFRLQPIRTYAVREGIIYRENLNGH